MNLGIIRQLAGFGAQGKLEECSAAGSTQVKPKNIAKSKPGFPWRSSSDIVSMLALEKSPRAELRLASL